jgi:hypothetical protein
MRAHEVKESGHEAESSETHPYLGAWAAGWPATASQMTAIRMTATEALKSVRGGSRPGAGRKPRPHVRTTLLLAPEVRDKLETLAHRHGNMSLAAEAAIRHAKVA